MSVKDFSIKLNSLAKYALVMVNSERGKLDMFMGELKPNIVNDVMV